MEAASFVADEQPIQTTLSSAIADVGNSRDVDSVYGQLHEAVAEARRYGANRTFWHDGNFPTPVVPPDLALPGEQRAI